MNNPDTQYERIEHLFPKQRGNVVIAHRTFWRALYHIGKTGCPWRALPKEFGKWSTIYRRFRYWIEIGIFDLIEKELQTQVIDRKGVKVLALDSTYVKVHPDGTGAPKKKDRNPSVKVEAV